MIQLPDDLVVEADGICYAVRDLTKPQKKKGGDTGYKTIAYYSQVESLVRGVAEILARRKVADGTIAGLVDLVDYATTTGSKVRHQVAAALEEQAA